MRTQIHGLVAVVWLAFGASACAVAAPPAAAFRDKPVTVAIPISTAARKAAVPMVQLRQVSSPNAALTVHVFWELAQADATTSVDHPNFLASVTSLANSAQTNRKPASYVLQLPAGAKKALGKLSSLRLTFVPASEIPPPGVSIGSISIE